MYKSRNILFIHNFAISYRLPLFNKIDEKFDVTFCFTRESCKNMVAKELPSRYEVLNLGTSYNLPQNLFKYLKMLATKKYDIIISGDPCTMETQFAFIISKLFKKPFVLFSEEWIAGNSFKRRLVSPIINLTVKYSDVCVVPSFRHKNHLISMGSSSEKIFIAPNASYTENIEITSMKKKEMRNCLGIGDRKIVLYLARIVEFKGLEYLLRAFKKIEFESDDIFLLIAGTGNNKSNMEELSRQLGLKNICFYGWVDEETKVLFLEMADIFVLPSIYHKGAEPWGLVLNEAMYHGKPIVITNMVGAAYSLVKDGINGYVVEEKNVNDLYVNIVKIISNSNLQQQMGLKSKEIIYSEFNYEKQAQGFIDAILSIEGK